MQSYTLLVEHINNTIKILKSNHINLFMKEFEEVLCIDYKTSTSTLVMKTSRFYVLKSNNNSIFNE